MGGRVDGSRNRCFRLANPPLRLPSSFRPAYNLGSFRRGPVKRIKAVYPGSFDPPTNGHLDLIERGSKIFDELVVAILRNPEKDPLFSVGERRAMLEALTADFRSSKVEVFDARAGE